MKTTYSLFIFSCLIIFSAYCKSNEENLFWKSDHAYLNQEPPTETPKIFAKGMLVDSGIVLGRVAFSEDGREFYYTYAAHWFDSNNSGVNVISFDGKNWSKPKLLAESVSNPTLSIDGSILYFGGMNSTVWRSKKTNDKWSNPTEYLNKNYGLYNFMPTKRGVFYVGSNGMSGSKGDYGTYDFSTFSMVGKNTVITSLGLPINTPGFDGDLYIAPDESYMIVSAEETATYESELHISFRKKNGTWTPSKSISPEINTGLAHRFGQYVSPDGKYLFYTQGTSEKDCHIYWIRWDKMLERLRS